MEARVCRALTCYDGPSLLGKSISGCRGAAVGPLTFVSTRWLWSRLIQTTVYMCCTLGEFSAKIYWSVSKISLGNLLNICWARFVHSLSKLHSTPHTTADAILTLRREFDKPLRPTRPWCLRPLESILQQMNAAPFFHFISSKIFTVSQLLVWRSAGSSQTPSMRHVVRCPAVCRSILAPIIFTARC